MQKALVKWKEKKMNKTNPDGQYTCSFGWKLEVEEEEIFNYRMWKQKEKNRLLETFMSK